MPAASTAACRARYGPRLSIVVTCARAGPIGDHSTYWNSGGTSFGRSGQIGARSDAKKAANG